MGRGSAFAPRPIIASGQPTSMERKLEMNDEAGGDAKIVLRFAAGCRFREARQEIFDLRGAERHPMEESHVNAATEGCSERVACAGNAETAATRVRNTEERLCKRSEARMPPVRNARTEKIGRQGAVDSRTENVISVIAAEIGDAAEPIVDLVGSRSAAAVKIETVHARSAWIVAKIGIADEDVEFRPTLLLRGRHRRDGKHCEQAHYHLPLHTTSLRFGFYRKHARQWRDLAYADRFRQGKQWAAKTRP